MRPSTSRLRRALHDLSPALYRVRVPLTGLRMLPLGQGVAPQQMPIPSSDGSGWREFGVGTRWGGQDETVWFHTEVAVPSEWRHSLENESIALALRLLLGVGEQDFFGWPEGLLYVNGALRQGINRHHPDVLLLPEDAHAGRLAFDVRAWSGISEHDHRVEYAELALLDRPTERLYYLLGAGADLLDILPDSDPILYELSGALEAAYDHVELRQPYSDAFYSSTRKALALLQERLATVNERHVSGNSPVVTAVGHGHLDVAWLWQTRHTREKTARTFGVATALMEHYPDYVFLHTTPQVFAWLKDDYPEMYQRVRSWIRLGRFEAAGAMWLESDCNLVSGESLVRQILHGQRFQREELGLDDYEVLWLPDAFGYTAALPQIMLRSGLKTFMTTKLSWNDTNAMPASTFRWRGIDGSEVLAHFITTPTPGARSPLEGIDTYNGMLTAASVLGIWQRYKQKAVNGELLLAYGYGDGGAGPSRQLIEQGYALRRLPGLPRLRFGRADEYFARLHDRVWGSHDLPTWDGDLYFEYHRGTYTTQAWLKRAHRQCEAALLLAEYLDAWRWSRNPSSAPDIRGALDDAWRALLLHEFHDILPGSSIHPVYEDARVSMDALAQTLDSMIAEAGVALIDAVGMPQGTLAALNPSPWAQQGAVVTLPAPEQHQGYSDAHGQTLASQKTTLSGQTEMLLEVPSAPPRGFALLMPARADEAPGAEVVGDDAARGGDRWLENVWFRLELNERGEITSLVDKRVPEGRELLQHGRVGNALEAYEDRPRNFEAWDIDAFYERKPFDVGAAEIELVEAGPLRATLRLRRQFLSSTILQDISLYRRIPRIDLATHIEWHEHNLLLKAAFPLDLRTRTATREIQYGALEIPTHRNTSWEQARFEVSAQRWIDLSEADYGVSLLNDGRYGHDVRESTLRLTLLRSPRLPDPEADQGEHRFTYSLFPHLGDWRAGGTAQAAYALNRPLRLFQVNTDAHATPSDVEAPFVTEPAQVVIEAIKRAADGDDLIVRLYEAYGSRCQAQIRAHEPLADVSECDLLERALTAEASSAYSAWEESDAASHDVPKWDANGWTCELRPYEVRTFRVRLATQ
ncbi:MAG TPA: glycoside hydrolase family 38 C-terminal domain-containing protein [Ktedonobacterales bacterium]|nr:glycoside hydrolase family 38 C-terminal domain-containing protein [Ktedonobacterales bacterium]